MSETKQTANRRSRNADARITPFNVAVGKVLKKLRLNAGMTQEELAKKLECSFKTISHWETGWGMPDDINAVLNAHQIHVLQCSQKGSFK